MTTKITSRFTGERTNELCGIDETFYGLTVMKEESEILFENVIYYEDLLKTMLIKEIIPLPELSNLVTTHLISEDFELVQYWETSL